MKKALFVSAGIAALALGVLGTVLPVLPTTPLLLLALYCFAKGSEKLNKWFRGTVLYQKYLAEYVQTKSLPLKQKLAIQVFAGLMMVISFMLIDNSVMRLILVMGFLVHNYVFIFKIKTRKAEAENNKGIIARKAQKAKYVRQKESGHEF
ncbi:MAG: YbaN family protein [Oscillospiraceae bacterium]|nr:YbaN family protein [Oscillospiraceae bacterium]